MKRKLVSLTLALLLTLGLAVPSLAAQDGFDIENGMLTEYNGPGGNVVIPDDVTSIDEMAFYGCTSLTGVTIPASVTSIGEWVFSGCTSLTGIDVAPENPAYCSIDGILFEKNQTGLGLVQYPTGKSGPYTIPDGVTRIGRSSFHGAGLTSITIPDSVTRIREGAFSGCTGLTSIAIPSGVTSVEDQTFYACIGLTSVAIPASVTSIGDSAFDGCTGLTDVYYEGAQEQWSSISINFGNDPLGGATIHYNSTMPGGQVVAYPSAQTVYVDDKPVEFAMYALKDAAGNPTNYIRVRDLAAVLSGTGAQFEVGWDGKVALIPGAAYTGSADKAPFDWEMSYSGYTAPTLVGGEEQYLEAIQIEYDGGGYTYYKLRDLGAALGFNVSWSADKGVFIETDKPYNAND